MANIYQFKTKQNSAANSVPEEKSMYELWLTIKDEKSYEFAICPQGQNAGMRQILLFIGTESQVQKEFDAITGSNACTETILALITCESYTYPGLRSTPEESGILEEIYAPEKFFELFGTTPREMGLKADIESVNTMLRECFSDHGLEPAFTIGSAEILDYLKQHTEVA